MGWDNVYGERTPKEKVQDIIAMHLGNFTSRIRDVFKEELKSTIKELKEKDLLDAVE